MVRVVQRGRYSVYVHAEGGERHHLPHCHVRWPDGKSVVALGSLEVLAGSDLPSDALDLLWEHRRELRRVWRLLNPKGSKQ